MNNIKLPVLNIDYEYWKNKNSFYSTDKLLPGDSISVGLKQAAKGNLLDIASIKTPHDLISKIEKRIKIVNLHNCSDTDLLIIFDLIQGWGGKQNRHSYNARLGKPPLRISDPSKFALSYKEVIETLFETKHVTRYDKKFIQSIVKGVESVDSLRLPFGSKHLFFWSWKSNFAKIYYIYDTRMKNLMKSIFLKTGVSYYEFLIFLEETTDKFNLRSPLIAERAIFGFSNHFFPNGSLCINNHQKNSKDFEEALKLSDGVKT